MRHARRHGVRVRHGLPAVAVLLVALFALALSAGDAPATKAYVHGPIGTYGCDACHLNYHTEPEAPPTSDYCQANCHSDYQIVRSADLCWSCHTPGQDMSWARTDASCLSTCHLRGDPSGPLSYDVAFTHTPHAGGSAACTSCHSLTKSATESGGSAHHTVPAPRLDLVSPAAAAPGSKVTLTGAKFSWAALVRFGGVDAAFSVVSDTSIVATVPAVAVSGPVTVLSAGGEAAGPAAFVVLRPEPQSPLLKLSASRRSVALGARVRLTGALTPFDTGRLVRVLVQRRTAGAWKAAASSSRPLSASGTYAWTYRPRSGGTYRARASATGVTSGWVAFRVSRP